MKGKASVVFEREAEVTGLKAPNGGPEATVTGIFKPPEDDPPSPYPLNAALPSGIKAIAGALVSEDPVVGTSDTSRERARNGLAGLALCVTLLSGVCGGVMSS